jgi:hypothetical protein
LYALIAPVPKLAMSRSALKRPKPARRDRYAPRLVEVILAPTRAMSRPSRSNSSTYPPVGASLPFTGARDPYVMKMRSPTA